MAKKDNVEVQERGLVTAWTLPAARSCRFKVACTGEEAGFEAINPGDAMLLLEESGEIAWGVRRVFFVRRELDKSIIYFDRFLDFERDMPLQTLRGDVKTLRKIGLDQVDAVLGAINWDALKTRTYPRTRNCCHSILQIFAHKGSETIQMGVRGLTFANCWRRSLPTTCSAPLSDRTRKSSA